MSIARFRESIERHARYSLAQPWEGLETERRQRAADAKTLYYLSIEYLLGRMLTNNLSNLGIYDLCRDTLRQMGFSLDAVQDAERDAALGNGGLGSPTRDRRRVPEGKTGQLAGVPYIEAQKQVDDTFKQPSEWATKAILNVARSGRFSSDRSVAEYARDIRGIASV